MRWVRLVVAVIVGYLVAVLANSAWVLYWYVDASTSTSGALVAMTVVMFAATGIFAGALLRPIAGPATRPAAYVLGGLLALVGIVNIALGVAVEPSWHTLLAIVIQAPAVILGSRLLAKDRR